MSLAALLLACGPTNPEATQPAVTTLPPFEDPAISDAYDGFFAWAEARGWTATPLRKRGARLERTWVLGTPGKQTKVAPRSGRLALAVFASSTPTHSYGLQWRAATTDEDGHGVSLLVVIGGKRITPDQVRLDLHLAGAEPIELGAPLTWEVGERVVQTARPEGLTAVQAHLAGYQGEAFADSATADLDALSAAVRSVLDGLDYTVCDYGPSPGQGIPGPCRPRAPTDAEQEAHQAAFAAELQRRRAAVADAVRWQAMIRMVTPTI
jgi:hypothetical protein